MANAESLGKKVLHALQKLSLKEGDILIVSDLQLMGVLTSQVMPGVPQCPVPYSPDGLSAIGTIDLKTLREVVAAAEQLEKARMVAADQPLPPREVVQ